MGAVVNRPILFINSLIYYYNMTTTIETATQAETLVQAINNATEPEIDGAWAILKYKEIGIYRKVASLCSLFGIDTDIVLNELPQDEEGRILDYKSRHIIHDSLIKVS